MYLNFKVIFINHNVSSSFQITIILTISSSEGGEVDGGGESMKPKKSRVDKTVPKSLLSLSSKQ